MGIAGDIAIIMMFALFGGLLAQALRLPLVVGYILAGVVVGPYTQGPTVTQVHEIELLADIGVALLLFTVGLEFTPATLRPVGAISLFGTPLQVIASALWGWVLGKLLGLDNLQALWMGCLISLSSTMVALKLLASQGFSKALSGRVMMGMLVIQDLAAIPMMIILPSLGKPGGSSSALIFSAVKAVVLIVSTLTFGARILPRLLRWVLNGGSHELFLITVGGVALGVGYVSYLCGLSFALGAFLAGLVLSESDYSHHALGTVGPLRDIFGMLFFVSVGMLVDPRFFFSNLHRILVVMVLVMIGKGLIFAAVASIFRYRNIVPIAVGLSLCQVGEFSFVLAREGRSANALGPDLYNLILVVAVLSMIVTPFVMHFAGPIYAAWRRYSPAPLGAVPQNGDDEYKDHVIVGGYGRVGTQIARVLRRNGYPCVVVDSNLAAFERARAAEIPAVFGDLTSEAVLHTLALEKARQVILTYNDPSTIHLSVMAIHHSVPKLDIVAEAQSAEHLAELAKMGVAHAVLPDFEAALEFIRLAMLTQCSDSERISLTLEEERRSNYHPTRKDTVAIPIPSGLIASLIPPGDAGSPETPPAV